MSIDIEQFSARLLGDAFLEASRSYHLRRAREFEAARSRPGDYVGDATPDEIAARDERLTSLANACRARASLAPLQCDEIDDAVALVLAEVEAP